MDLEANLFRQLGSSNRKVDLHNNIAVPTLVIGASHDTMDPEHYEMDGERSKER